MNIWNYLKVWHGKEKSEKEIKLKKELPELKRIKLDLIKLWDSFENKTIQEKIDLLKEYSERKYIFQHRISNRHMRSIFNNYHRFKKFYKKPCKVCNSNPVVRHHIIQLQNGGDNRKTNIIPLCENCHSQIHTWLVPSFYHQQISKMDQEYRKTVS